LERNKQIDQLSCKIDNLLNEETKTNDFAIKELRKLVTKALDSTYKQAREDAGIGSVGETINLGLEVIASLFSKEKAVNAATNVRRDFEIDQENLDKKWELAKPKLDSLPTNELFWILYINNKNGFESVLNFLLRSNF